MDTGVGGRPGSSCGVPPDPRGMGKLELNFLRQNRLRSRHLRACLPVFVLAEGFTGLFEADSHQGRSRGIRT